MSSMVNFSSLELMELHINTLFCCDADGRMRCVNEAGEPAAPLFYMGRTTQGNFWRFRDDLPATTVEKLDDLCQSEPLAADLASPPQHYAAIKAVIDDHRHLPLSRQQEYRGPAYWIAEDSTPSTRVVLISETNAELLHPNFIWMLPFEQNRDIDPVTVAIEKGRAVSVCFCSRRPALATEAGVETLPAFRGRGYATDTVAVWAAEVRRLGCTPLYSTSWDNLASQAVARKLRMVLYGEDWSIR